MYTCNIIEQMEKEILGKYADKLLHYVAVSLISE